MRLHLTLLLSSILALPLVACGDDGGGNNNGSPDAGDNNSNKVDVTADIEGDATWAAGKDYYLEDNIFVRNGTLTIEPGVTIYGDQGTSLVITSSAKIDAQGTKDAPIVFTSVMPEGSRAAGDWGGLVLLGKAPINVAGGTDNIEGFPAGTPGTEYGGTDETGSCGTLKYVRVEFAGFELSPDNELNGISVGGCGSGTTMSYVQIHKGNDDGIECWGGAAKIDHFVISQPDDDGLDWDYGFHGDVQFLIVQQAATAGNNGFEADNNGDAHDATPRSNPTIWNATLIGSGADPGNAYKTQQGMLLRRGTAGSIHNVIVAHFADVAIDVADYATVQQAEASTPALNVTSTYFFDNANDANMGWPTDFDLDSSSGVQNDCDSNDMNCFDEAAYFSATGEMNSFADPQLEDETNLTAPNFAPKANAPVLTGGETPPSGFDTSATFIGAIGTDDWTAGWTSFPAN